MSIALEGHHPDIIIFETHCDKTKFMNIINANLNSIHFFFFFFVSSTLDFLLQSVVYKGNVTLLFYLF